MEKFLAIVGLIIGSIILTVYSGFVFSTIWGFFIVPLGVPALGVAHAVGLISVLAYPLMGMGIRLENLAQAAGIETDISSLYHKLWTGLFAVSFVWAWAAVAHAFM